MTVIVDSVLVVEALDKRGEKHGEAREILLDIMQGLYGLAYMVDHSVSETIRMVMERGGREAAIRVGKLLLEVRPFTILHVSDDIMDEAWRVFQATQLGFDKALLVACARAYNIEYIATLDESLASVYPVISPGRKPRRRGFKLGLED